MGNRTKPNLIVTMDDQGTICLKSQSTFKTTEIKFKLNEPFEETTADDRKTRVRNREKNTLNYSLLSLCFAGFITALVCFLSHQTVVTMENGKLVQKQSWDGKETNIEREITDGKMIAVRTFILKSK